MKRALSLALAIFLASSGTIAIAETVNTNEYGIVAMGAMGDNGRPVTPD